MDDKYIDGQSTATSSSASLQTGGKGLATGKGLTSVKGSSKASKSDSSLSTHIESQNPCPSPNGTQTTRLTLVVNPQRLKDIYDMPDDEVELIEPNLFDFSGTLQTPLKSVVDSGKAFRDPKRNVKYQFPI